MMKNSKLSKLLVAGVSVAMLASALAPMAFAEDSSVAGANPFTVYCQFVTEDTNGTLKYVNAWEKGTESNDFWTANSTYSKWPYHTFFAGKMKADGKTPDYEDQKISFGDLVCSDKYDVVGWKVLKSANDQGWDLTGEIFDVLEKDSSITINSLKSNYTKKDNIADGTAGIVWVVKEKTHVTVDTNTGINLTKGTEYTDATKWELNGEEVDGVPTSVEMMDKITLPEYTVAKDYNWAGASAKLTVGGETIKEYKDIPNGGEIDLSVVNLKQYAKDYPTSDIKLEITVKIEAVKAVKMEVANNAKIVDKDGKVVAENDNVIVGTDANNKLLLAKVKPATVYKYGKTQPLPTVVIEKDGKVDAQYTFSHWEVVDDSKQLVMADGKTLANGYVLKNNEFVASEFGATPVATSVTVTAVFVKGDDTTEYTYDKAKTPNDVINRYKDGVKVDSKTWAAYNEFEGGVFVNEVDGTISYYLPKNNNGKFVVDTTVNGIADGIYFENGVQDTKAYGLKKVVGDDSAFVYLVSDGVYQADYNGMWEDEDGSVYKLEKGCTNTTFTGVYDRGDWALSVKDSKVQKDETGFVLYGDTQYWFINGICNMKETEAVRQHTNGHFYYTVGAKIDFTFNGTVNGHTFVNGEAAE